MKVSFVVPTRNQARFIRQCLDSCLAQRCADREVMVVDGRSTDGTQQILADYGDRIRWLSEEDSGQSEALNKGVRRVSGDLIAWLNSDDFYPADDVLPEVTAAFDRDPRLDIVYGDGLLVDVAGAPIRRQQSGPLAGGRALLIRHWRLMQPAVFFRRALFLEVGGAREDLHWAMDYDLWLRMFPRARAVRYLPRTLACTRAHAGAKTLQAMLDQIREVRRVKRAHLGQLALSPRERLAMSLSDAQLYVYWLAVRLGLRRAA